MYVKEVTVENQVGLHARPATFFIQKANEFKSSIWVEKEERRVNAKSLLGVLSLGIVGGTTIRIIADGADEQAAVDGLISWWSPALQSKSVSQATESGGGSLPLFWYEFLPGRRSAAESPVPQTWEKVLHDQSRALPESLYAAAAARGVYHPGQK